MIVKMIIPLVSALIYVLLELHLVIPLSRSFCQRCQTCKVEYTIGSVIETFLLFAKDLDDKVLSKS